MGLFKLKGPGEAVLGTGAFRAAFAGSESLRQTVHL